MNTYDGKAKFNGADCTATDGKYPQPASCEQQYNICYDQFYELWGNCWTAPPLGLPWYVVLYLNPSRWCCTSDPDSGECPPARGGVNYCPPSDGGGGGAKQERRFSHLRCAAAACTPLAPDPTTHTGPAPPLRPRRPRRLSRLRRAAHRCRRRPQLTISSCEQAATAPTLPSSRRQASL